MQVDDRQENARLNMDPKIKEIERGGLTQTLTVFSKVHNSANTDLIFYTLKERKTIGRLFSNLKILLYEF